jgi:hypothetical protein
VRGADVDGKRFVCRVSDALHRRATDRANNGEPKHVAWKPEVKRRDDAAERWKRRKLVARDWAEVGHPFEQRGPIARRDEAAMTADAVDKSPNTVICQLEANAATWAVDLELGGTWCGSRWSVRATRDAALCPRRNQHVGRVVDPVGWLRPTETRTATKTAA